MNLFDQLEQKQCSRCNETKPLTEFVKLKRSPDGREGRCRKCRAVTRRVWEAANKDRRRARDKKWREAHPERMRQIFAKAYRKRAHLVAAQNKAKRLADPTLRFRLHLKEKFQITLGQYQVMTDAQQGRCAICQELPSGRRTKLCIDHDHQTGEIRGLLCDTCNRALGLLKDDAEVLQKAIGYLSAHRFKLKVA